MPPDESIDFPAPHGNAGIQDVARRANVSIATVSRVLNGVKAKTTQATAERVRQAARDLDYRPAQAGRALRLKQTKLVALLIPDISNAFYATIARSTEAALRERDHTMVLCNTAEDPDLQDFYLEEMQSHQVRGIALLGAVASPGLSRALERRIPIVFINRKPPDERGVFVGIDNFSAGRTVAKHFIDRGYRDCATMRGPLHSSASRERFEGFLMGLQEGGVHLQDDRILDGDLSLESGYVCAEKLLVPGRAPRAIFCGNDLMAYGIFRYCREHDIAVPGDLALVGFDDNPLNDWIAPWLTTIHVPYNSFGASVSRALATLWSGNAVEESQIILPHHLKLRGSAE